jgi:hypothetical protein
MNIEISLDLLQPDKAYVLKWLRPDQRGELIRVVLQASYEELKRLNGEGGGHVK